ncbi:hypothetical protein [Polyangium sp. 15x6]|uniref:hypothetical protein n=1 Tax=Polyangium sp. 15x6 TaxID=3042687 RepID=UPI00249C83DF|nr:hypothetical protein [Polyangium sp. 15x6]MDI3288881.1 hypothetical protein [Polyangium sp. 15x6]
MATYDPIKALSGARGTFYDPRLPYVHFVSDDGKLSRVRVTPSEVDAEGSKRITKSTTHHLDVRAEGFDVRWSNTIAFPNGALQAIGSARIALITTLPSEGFAGISPDMLSQMTINDTALAEPGTSTTGNVYAVKTSEGNFAKVRIYKDGMGNTVMDWTTYRTKNDPVELGSGFGSPTDLILTSTSSETTAYVCGQNSFGEGCVYVASSTNTAKPAFGSSPFTIAEGLASPQQMVFEPDSRMLLVADGSTLVAVDSDINNAGNVFNLLEHAPLSGIQGVALKKEAGSSRVYFSRSDNNAIYTGRLNLVEMKVEYDTNPVVSLSGPVGSLSWADEEQSALLVSVGEDAAVPANGNKLIRISLADPTDVQDLLEGVTTAGEPRSVEVITSTRIVMTSSVGIGDLNTGLPIGLDVPLGIGFVPFQSIIQSGEKSGLANTMDLGGYFFKVADVPFGGTLQFMLNHAKAYQDGHRYFQVRFIKDGVTRQITAGFTDLKWSSSLQRFEPKAVAAETVGSRTGCYPVRVPGDLWYNAHIGALLNTTSLPNGLHTLEISLLDASGVVVGVFSRKIFIENAPCRVKFLSFLVNGQPLTSACGVYQYVSKDDPVKLDFEAGYDGLTTASYRLVVYVGGKQIAQQSGAFDPATPLFSQSFAKLRDLMGKCNIATISAAMSISPRVIDGHKYIGGASTSGAFSLVPASFDIDEP